MGRLTEKRWFKDLRPDEETTTICVDGYFVEVVENYDVFSCGKEAHYYLVGEAIDKLAEYEEAEEQGLLLRLPCKVGDKVYKIWSCGRHGKSIAEFEVAHIDVDSLPEIEFSFFNSKSHPSSYWFAKKTDIGKTVFLAKEEAEAALEKMKGE